MILCLFLFVLLPLLPVVGLLNASRTCSIMLRPSATPLLSYLYRSLFLILRNNVCSQDFRSTQFLTRAHARARWMNRLCVFFLQSFV
uniref:Secreted protein n=1 Tax=Anopheles atroparvus TaxID=41427 RepID=A0AAG5DKR7_ANOAO